MKIATLNIWRWSTWYAQESRVKTLHLVLVA